MNNPKAVSYTHLDVYKRQPRTLATLMDGYARTPGVNLHGIQVPQYAHLLPEDVYKRQVFLHPSLYLRHVFMVVGWRWGYDIYAVSYTHLVADVNPRPTLSERLTMTMLR